MTVQKASGKGLRIAKIIQIVCLIAALIYADILYRWPKTDEISWGVGLDKSMLQNITIGLAIFSVLSLASGYFMSKIMILTYKFKKPKQRKWLTFRFGLTDNERMAIEVYILRAAMVIAVAVFGLVLGMLGAAWQNTLPFLVISVAVLVITFPTNKSWNKILEKLAETPQGQ